LDRLLPRFDLEGEALRRRTIDDIPAVAPEPVAVAGRESADG
jgi:hypothetical protein